MRYGIPRSSTRVTQKQQKRSRSTFGLPSDSDDYYDSDSDLFSEASSDPDSSDTDSSLSYSRDDSLDYNSESEASKSKLKLRQSTHTRDEMKYIEETVAAIRLRTRHYDPYEDWQRQTRVDAFKTARKDLTASQTKFLDEQDRMRVKQSDLNASRGSYEVSEVQRRLEAMRAHGQAAENKLRMDHDARAQKIWQRMEMAIQFEEEKVRRKLEDERRIREAEEQKKREEELKKKLEEEKKRAEEEKKRKEEEAAKEEKRKEEERQKQEDEERKKKELEEEQAAQATKEQRKAIGLTTSREDWISARTDLKRLKAEIMQKVKGDKQVKSEWSKWRRQITPKIGQLTDNEDQINTISRQLYEILNPPTGAHHPLVYHALLSSLSKAILLQAETEVTAEKNAAKPLARVAFNLLDTLEGFPEIFYAKLVQRIGGWPIPSPVPSQDVAYPSNTGPDQPPQMVDWQNDADRTKAMGYRKSGGTDDFESSSEYLGRVAGIMRVYFQILKIKPERQPLKYTFQLPRYWVWVSRLVGDRHLLESAVGAQLLYTALEVLGSHAREVWGRQWDKMLEFIYECATKGFAGGKMIGGTTPEGVAARTRVQLEVERIMKDYLDRKPARAKSIIRARLRAQRRRRRRIQACRPLQPTPTTAVNETMELENNQVKADCRSPGSNDIPSGTSFISVQSSLICADTVATYLCENHSKIQAELNEGLLRLGYNGEYGLQAGFDEDFLRNFNDLRPRVFLSLNGDLQHDLQSISRVIAPIFAPHATILCAKSQTYPLIESHELGDHGAQELSSFLSSAPPQQLSDASHGGQQSTQATQGADQGSNHESRGDSLGTNNHGGDQGEDQHRKGGSGSEQQDTKGKGKAEQSEGRSEEPPQNYRRRVELDLDVPVFIESSAGTHEFTISTQVGLELRSNRNGDSETWPVIKTKTSAKAPLCSINFDDLNIALGQGEAYSLESLKVRMRATPFQTMCRDFSPVETTVCTDIKSSQETHKKLGANAMVTAKPEAKLEIGREQVGREETTKSEWNIDAYSIKKVNLNAREVIVDYTRHRSEQEKPDIRTKSFDPLPKAVFIYESDQATRTVEIFLQALWVTGSQKPNFIRARLQGMSSFPLHHNLLHQMSVILNLRDIIDQGRDDLILMANTADVAEQDVIQHGRAVGNGEEVFQKVEIRIKGDREAVPLRVPLHRGVIEALQGHINPVNLKEGDRKVMSPRD